MSEKVLPEVRGTRPWIFNTPLFSNPKSEQGVGLRPRSCLGPQVARIGRRPAVRCRGGVGRPAPNSTFRTSRLGKIAPGRARLTSRQYLKPASL